MEHLSGGYFQIVRKVIHKDHTKLPIVVAAANDGGSDDNTSEDDNGTWFYCQRTRGGSMIGCKNT